MAPIATFVREDQCMNVAENLSTAFTSDELTKSVWTFNHKADHFPTASIAGKTTYPVRISQHPGPNDAIASEELKT